MKKVIIGFYLFLLSVAIVSAQPEADTACKQNIENVLKVRDVKEKYETVQYIYKYKNGGFPKNDSFLNEFFKSVRGFPYWKEQKDSTFSEKPGKLVKVEFLSKEEMTGYLEQLNCTPEKALYSKCPDAEIAKGDVVMFMLKHFSVPLWLKKDYYKGDCPIVSNNEFDY